MPAYAQPHLRHFFILSLAVAFASHVHASGPPEAFSSDKALPVEEVNSAPKEAMIGTPTAIKQLKQRLSTAVSESNIVSLIQRQADENEEGIAALERKLTKETAQLTESVQNLAESFSKDQQHRYERILAHAQKLQEVFDTHDESLRAMLHPVTTWLIPFIMEVVAAIAIALLARRGYKFLVAPAVV